MAAATKTDIEKVVRKILDEQSGDAHVGGANGATLKAIQRVSRLLTDQIIPRLGVEADDAEVEDGGEDDVVGDDDGAEAPAEDVPMVVTEAFQAAYRSLSADQAEALASLFTAIGQEMGAGSDEREEGEEGEDGNAGTSPAEDVQTPPIRKRRFPRG
jgi:hypothetical protein